MMINRISGPLFSRLIGSFFFAVSCCLPPALFAANPLTPVIEVEQGVLTQGQKSQANIDTLADEAFELVQEYRNLLRIQQNLTLYNDNLEDMVHSQETEKESLKRQIEEIKVTQSEIVPLMLRMVAGLEALVVADIPFLLEERLARVEGIQALMRRADVNISEKFRRIMAAYQTEADYGRTIEAYQGELVTEEGLLRSVEFLRIGRLVLAYQTLDRSESGFWDVQQRAWIPLDARYNQSIRQGLRIASRQAAPELIQVPVMVSTAEKEYRIIPTAEAEVVQ